jgi:hypothetical protein
MYWTKKKKTAIVLVKDRIHYRTYTNCTAATANPADDGTGRHAAAERTPQ